MHRRSFLGALVGTFVVAVVSRLPWSPHGAVFRVIKVDPDGSGADYSGHLGAIVYNAERCCKNCSIIFAAWKPGEDVENGPAFCHDELTPVNAPARRIMAEAGAAYARGGAASFALAT